MIDELTQGNHRPYREWPSRIHPPTAWGSDGQPTPRPPAAWATDLSIALGRLQAHLAGLLTQAQAALDPHDHGDCDCDECREGRKK